MLYILLLDPTVFNDDPETPFTHRGYGKILSGKTNEWETSPTFEGSQDDINGKVHIWFSNEGHTSSIRANEGGPSYKAPWVVYTKPARGGSYEKFLESQGAEALLQAATMMAIHYKADVAEPIQKLLNQLHDLDYIRDQCQRLGGQHGMAMWSRTPQPDPQLQTVRDAATAGYIEVRNGNMYLTEQGRVFADTSLEGFNSRESWHGWTSTRY